jgi:hypothetical protein
MERAYVNAAPGGVLSVQFVSDGRIVSVGRIRVWGADCESPRRASSPSGALLTKVTSSCDAKCTIAGGLRGTDTQLGRQWISAISYRPVITGSSLSPPTTPAVRTL